MATLAGIVIGVAFILLAIQIIITHHRNARQSYYCDTCSQYLGTGRQRERVCPNCGDFRYYTKTDKEP
jgi:Zn finger protein HypA/HybF involved in hydrogenase expression